MQEAAKNLLLVLVALFPIVDPLGGSPFFLALTKEYAPEARKALSWRIAMNSFFLLIGSYFVGTYVLAFFGISLPVVQVGGGLVVIATGWALLKQRDDEKHDVHRTVQPQDTFRQAFHPLTMPLTVGPVGRCSAFQKVAPGGFPNRRQAERLLCIKSACDRLLRSEELFTRFTNNTPAWQGRRSYAPSRRGFFATSW